MVGLFAAVTVLGLAGAALVAYRWRLADAVAGRLHELEVLKAKREVDAVAVRELVVRVRELEERASAEAWGRKR